MEVSDTIAAQATPPGRGGVGIIRVSGPKVLSIAQSILNKNLKPRYATFCNFSAGNESIIDRGVAIYFPAPHSVTGEDVLELQGHGGQVVMNLLLERVLELGARLAKPGEFIERSFLNRKLDLSQVEAVADLINASSSRAAQNAIRSLRGEFSQQINGLVQKLIDLRANIEATIDFVEEVEPKDITSFKTSVVHLLSQIKNLKNISQQGAILNEGIKVVITGDPNVGKSSLLNYFSGEERAIVTDIPGTTRDVLHVTIDIDGLPITLLDTAGLNDNPDSIEAEGIRRAIAEVKRADQVLLVIDLSAKKQIDISKISTDFLKLISNQGRLTVVCNKIDLTGENPKIVKGEKFDIIYLSAITGRGLDLLKKNLKDCAGTYVIENGFSARRRHTAALAKAENYLQCINDDLFFDNKIELIAEELKETQQALGEITGEFVPDDLLNKIFSEFCVGK